MSIPILESLSGQVALVTGANRGIGAQVALDLSNLGATVYAGCRDPSTLDGIQSESDGRIIPIKLDVTNEDKITVAVAQIIADVGRLDLLVNNAGIGDGHGSVLHKLDTDILDGVMATNLRGPMLMAKHAVPHLVERRGGRIVTVSSGMGGLEGMGGGNPAYRISKTAVNGLTAYLNGEYGPRGLISAAVCPGWVRTDMGGENASRSVEVGAASVVHACTLAEGAPSGKFWRDGSIIDW
jgi:NAD(P)-dependent dehydrogenase (short-subunit alcohol dehydrogenase family)